MINSIFGAFFAAATSFASSIPTIMGAAHGIILSKLVGMMMRGPFSYVVAVSVLIFAPPAILASPLFLIIGADAMVVWLGSSVAWAIFLATR